MAELDEIIHQPLRLRIMAALTALPDAQGLDFTRLKKLTGATDGNLGAHIETLSKAGYVAVTKAFVGKKSFRGARNASEPGTSSWSARAKHARDSGSARMARRPE